MAYRKLALVSTHFLVSAYCVVGINHTLIGTYMPNDLRFATHACVSVHMSNVKLGMWPTIPVSDRIAFQ